MMIDELIEKLSLFFSLFLKKKVMNYFIHLSFILLHILPKNATHTAFLYALIQVRNCNKRLYYKKTKKISLYTVCVIPGVFVLLLPHRSNWRDCVCLCLCGVELTRTQTGMWVVGSLFPGCAVMGSWDPLQFQINHRALEQLGLHVD